MKAGLTPRIRLNASERCMGALRYDRFGCANTAYLPSGTSRLRLGEDDQLERVQ